MLLITLSVAIAEAIGAWISGGLVLFADAAHMAADVAGIGLSLLAVVFASRPPTPKRTFGYARAEILAAVVNAVVLFAMSVFIIAEAISRLSHPDAGRVAAAGRLRYRGPGGQRDQPLGAAAGPVGEPEHQGRVP